MIRDLNKGLKNPVYGAAILSKRAKQKLQNKNQTEEQRREKEEIEKVGLYKYRYKDIMKLGEETYEEWITRKEAEDLEAKKSSLEKTSGQMKPVFVRNSAFSFRSIMYSIVISFHVLSRC